MVLAVCGSFPLCPLQVNHPPKVLLVLPKPNAVVDKASAIRYSIAVSDEEDGDSKFDEINPREVLLEVAAVSDTHSVKSSSKDRAALYAMLGSNCLNCHAFNSKLIGPSFSDIGTRYANQNADILVRHVRDGSKGVWGAIAMPSHPELNDNQIAEMVQWILRYNSLTDVSYYTGTEGSFRWPSSLSNASSYWWSITAGYMDHQRAVGEQHVFLR